MSDDDLENCPPSRTFDDALFCMRFNHAFLERDADRVAFLFAGWLQANRLILSAPQRKALLSVLRISEEG